VAKKTALVLGVIGGVGAIVAKTLIKDGWSVIGTVRAADQIAEAKAEVPGLQHVVAVDMSNADNVEPALATVLKPDMTLNAVVNAAATCPFGPLETTPVSELRRVLEINAAGPVGVYRACIAHLRRSKGHLVLVTSIAGRVAFPFIGHYSASKFAVEALADAMRRESREWGVKVVVIEPGGMYSRMVDLQLKQVVERKAALSAEERARYGHYYDAHEEGVSGRSGGLMPPDVTAEVIIKVLNTENPETRYTAGEAAARICPLPRTMTDRELDDMTTTGVPVDQGRASA